MTRKEVLDAMWKLNACYNARVDFWESGDTPQAFWERIHPAWRLWLIDALWRFDFIGWFDKEAAFQVTDHPVYWGIRDNWDDGAVIGSSKVILALFPWASVEGILEQYIRSEGCG